MQAQYDSFKGPLLELSEVITQLGHNNRKITILKIDPEGAEWEIFKSLRSLNSTS